MPVLAAALLTAAATRCPAEDFLSVFARVGKPGTITHDSGELDESLSRDWASVTGKLGNSALAIADRYSDHDEDSFWFSSRMHLNADAGPRFWEKKFPGSSRNLAYATASVSTDHTFTFSETTSFQMTTLLLDPARLASYGTTFYIVKEPRGPALDRLYFQRYQTTGFDAFIGTLPAGSYSVYASLDTETEEVGPTYRYGAIKSSAGEVWGNVGVDFFRKLTPAFLEWSEDVTAFGHSVTRLSRSAGNFSTQLDRQDTALRSAKRNAPGGFASDFHVVPAADKKGMLSIVATDTARVAGFTSAVDTTINSYKACQKFHDNVVRLASRAVEAGHFPAATLLHLDKQVPSLAAGHAGHLESVSFFRKNRTYTAAEVRQIAERYDSAVAFFDQNLPVLRKRSDSLRGLHGFITDGLTEVWDDYQVALRDETRLKGQEDNVLDGMLNTISGLIW